MHIVSCLWIIGLQTSARARTSTYRRLQTVWIYRDAGVPRDVMIYIHSMIRAYENREDI